MSRSTFDNEFVGSFSMLVARVNEPFDGAEQLDVDELIFSIQIFLSTRF